MFSYLSFKTWFPSPSPLRPVLAFLTLALSLHAQVSTEWDQSKSYDRGVVVIHSEELYLAHTQVPSGVELTNDLYWQKLEDEDPDSSKRPTLIRPINGNRTACGKLLCPMV